MIELISKFLTPPGGWHYMQGFNILKSGSYAELVQTVTDHRKNNHLETDNVELDIQKQLSEKYPHLKITK